MLGRALSMALSSARVARRLLRLAMREFRLDALGQVWPAKPTTLNLLLNDICNSRCQMCLIWKQKRDKEITPNELAQILSDSLFRRVRYIGVSGGEPTLRQDLPDLFRVISEKRPRLMGIGIITNAIQRQQVIGRIETAAEVCLSAGIPFNVMVSLDGIGEVHDRVRGHPGNFESAVAVLRHFRDHTEIPVCIGCTITKDNAWHVDEVLDFARAEGLYGRFRVAEFIARLYNAEQTDCIRNFSLSERYHLGLFFAKLEYTYEDDPQIRRTYQNIRQMLMYKAKRAIGCPYQTDAVALDCRGQLLYCAPKSPILGSCLQTAASRLYRENIPKRKLILDQQCDDCIHDYHAKETVSDALQQYREVYWRRRLSLDRALRVARKTRNIRSEPSHFLGNTHLIVGWYGTETAGDKAILAELVHRIRRTSPQSRITVASLYPYVTQTTVREMNLGDISIIPTYSAEFATLARQADVVVMGGGPLMHIEPLGTVLWAFVQAKRARHATWLAGCGIGPLDQGQLYSDAVREIIRFTDRIELRDLASQEWVLDMTARDDIKVTEDLAVDFVKRWDQRERVKVLKQDRTLNLYLREWTRDYKRELSDEQFEQVRDDGEREMGRLIHELCSEFDLRPRLLPMHHFCVGCDDRDFSRRFAREYLSDLDPEVERRPLSPQELLHSMCSGRFALCMRFHSVLFAHTLKVPFFAVDYTHGGKIHAFLTERGMRDRMVSMRELAAGKWMRIARIVKTCLKGSVDRLPDASRT